MRQGGDTDVRGTLIALAATVAVAVLGAPALARPERPAAKLTLVQSGMTFKGALTGGRIACRAKRSISLTFHYSGGGRLALGRTRTSAGGRYVVRNVAFDGSGYVLAKAARSAGCPGVISNRVPIFGS